MMARDERGELVIFFIDHFRFVDLFVRVSNSVAITMYENLGYSVFRKVLQYYSGDKVCESDEISGHQATLEARR